MGQDMNIRLIEKSSWPHVSRRISQIGGLLGALALAFIASIIFGIYP
jgi:hypothetical protein